MSSAISLVFAGAGALTAAVGGGMLLARCFRAPRPDLIAWSLALIALLVSLGAQLLGYLSGYDAAMFRAMAIGGLVLAPLATALGLTEIASRGLAARFCARVYIGALAIVAVVILFSDQLGSTTFTKSWPNPHTYYQSPPNYILYAVSVVTVLITLIAAGARHDPIGRPRLEPGEHPAGGGRRRRADAGLSRHRPARQVRGQAEPGAHPGIHAAARDRGGPHRLVRPQARPAGHRRAARQPAPQRRHARRERDARDGRDLDRYPGERAAEFDRFDDSGGYGNLYRPDPVPEKARLGPPGTGDYGHEYGERFDDDYGGGYQTGNSRPGRLRPP